MVILITIGVLLSISRVFILLELEFTELVFSYLGAFWTKIAECSRRCPMPPTATDDVTEGRCWWLCVWNILTQMSHLIVIEHAYGWLLRR